MKKAPLAMNYIRIAFVMVLLGLSLEVGCVRRRLPVEKTSLELQALQARTFETSKEIAFRAVISVFQDKGYTISTADLATGFITAASAAATQQGRTRSKINSVRATATVETFPDGKTQVRVNLVESQELSTKNGMRGQVDKPILDPAIYSNLYVKIEEAIFIRSTTH